MAPPWNCGSLTEIWLNSSWGYKITLQFHSVDVFTQSSVSKTCVHFLKYLEMDPHNIFPQRLIRHYQAVNKRGSGSRKVRLSETHTQLCSLSLPSKLLSCSYSILKHHPEIKACPWELYFKPHTYTKYVFHWGREKKKIPIPMPIQCFVSFGSCLCSTKFNQYAEHLCCTADGRAAEESRWADRQSCWQLSKTVLQVAIADISQ